MNEALPRVAELTGEEYARHQARMAQQVGVEAIEQALHGETTDVVEIVLWVRGREIRTNTTDATVARIMSILTGAAD